MGDSKASTINKDNKQSSVASYNYDPYSSNLSQIYNKNPRTTDHQDYDDDDRSRGNDGDKEDNDDDDDDDLDGIVGDEDDVDDLDMDDPNSSLALNAAVAAELMENISDQDLVMQILNNIQTRFKNFEDILVDIRCQLSEIHCRDDDILKRMVTINDEIAELNLIESYEASAKSSIGGGNSETYTDLIAELLPEQVVGLVVPPPSNHSGGNKVGDARITGTYPKQ